MSIDPLLRHDRTLRFLQKAFPWNSPPRREALLDLACKLQVTIHLPPISSDDPQHQVALLATTNVVGRIPLGKLRIAIGHASFDLDLPPYRGATLDEALGNLCTGLGLEAEVNADSRGEAFTIDISTPAERTRWLVALDGGRAYFGQEHLRSTKSYHPVGCYTAASMIGGEVIRAWGRAAAEADIGVPADRFASRTRPAESRWLDLSPGPLEVVNKSVYSTGQRAIDWVSCGAVNQAVLAVLAASPGFEMTGRIFDPGRVDPPDLNRSLLSFVSDIGESKAQVGASVLGGLVWQLGRYPEVLDAAPSPWIVCGTDDPAVRPICQQLWPRLLVVTATEDIFGYAAWHARDTPEAFCGACEPAPPFTGDDPIPTSAPTSVATGTAAAALLLKLAAGGRPPHRTDILSLRLDSSLAIDRSNPPPNRACSLCA